MSEAASTTKKPAEAQAPDPASASEKEQNAAAEVGRFDSVAVEASGDTRVMLGPEIEIFPDKPRPDLASFGTQAFEAKVANHTGRHFALICHRNVFPRVANIATYKNIKNTTILPLVDAGVVWWLPEKRQHFALVFERPARRLMEDLDRSPIPALDEDALFTHLIRPVVDALHTLRNMDMVHGAINLQNLFFASSEANDRILLGECLSSPFSYGQHVLYEPIVRGMADRAGRGMGSLKDDLYAFGVCVALIARGRNVMAGKSESDILKLKMDHGSYSAIVERERMPSGISEFLRGVLSDDDSQRWDVDEALKWLEGRRLSPKQPRTTMKANQVFIYGSHKYAHLRPLTYALAQSPQDAAPVLEREALFQWLKKNFDDKHLHESYQEATEIGKERNRTVMGPDRLTARACIALDPDAPLFYKNHALFPRGYGTALADVMARGGDIQPFGEILSFQLFDMWFRAQLSVLSEAAYLASQLEKCRSFLVQKIAGYGMERVLYTMCKEVPCMSPMLREFYVLSPGGILRALEVLSRRPERPSAVLDRHIVAFISVREPKMVDPHLGMVVSTDKGTQLVGIVRTLAAIQKRFKTGPMPGVGNWMISMADVALERLNDRDLRQTMTKKINKLADGGDLGDLLEIIDNPLVLQNDINGFAAAQMEYMTLTRERQMHEERLRTKAMLGRATGRQTAMLVSAILSALVVLSILLFKFSRFFGA